MREAEEKVMKFHSHNYLKEIKELKYLWGKGSQTKTYWFRFLEEELWMWSQEGQTLFSREKATKQILAIVHSATPKRLKNAQNFDEVLD